MRSTCQLTLKDTTFLKNKSNYEGGALAILSGSLTTDHSHFTENEAKHSFGGAIDIRGNVEVTNIGFTKFTENRAFAGGGAINCESSGGVININTSKFHQNRGTNQFAPGSDGGAIRNHCNMSIIRANFSENSTKGIGGAIYHSPGVNDSPSLSIERAYFVDNRAGADGVPGTGGAIYIGSIFTLRQSSFYRNVARGPGGGIYLSSNIGNEQVDISNVTLDGNQAVLSEADLINGPMLSNGGAIWVGGEVSNVQILNSTIVDNIGREALFTNASPNGNEHTVRFKNDIIATNNVTPLCGGDTLRLDLIAQNIVFDDTSCDNDQIQFVPQDPQLAGAAFGGVFGMEYRLPSPRGPAAAAGLSAICTDPRSAGSIS